MRLMNESRVSSTECLQNMKVNDVKDSPLEACLLIKDVAGEHAGVKINGGGFAGSIICLVEDSVYQNVLKVAKDRYGDNNVHEISIRDVGPCEL